MSHQRLETAIEDFQRTLEELGGDLDFILREWEHSKGARHEDIPKRRRAVLSMVKEAHKATKKVRDDLDWNVDRGV